MATPAAKPTAWQDNLTGAERNAYAALDALFGQYGLSSLAPKILEFVQRGYEPDTIQLLLQDTDEWRTRFAGNEARRKAGLNVLTPAQYLALESSYRQTMSSYGLPKTFYDSPDDYAGLMAADISPEEVKTRAEAAWRFTQDTNSNAKRMLRDYYGVDDGLITAYFLNPEKGQALIERQAAAVGYGGIAADQGLSVSRQKAESWFDQGVSVSQVATGVAQAASIADDVTEMGNRYGIGYSSDDALDETVSGLASARRKRERITGRESAQFGGATGTASFGSRDTGGF